MWLILISQRSDYKTLSTAIVFCHRFFLRQSHAKNDRWAIATACMFLAGKVEENPRHLKDVTIISYEIIHKNDVAAPHIKEVYKQQRQLVLRAEKLVISTLNFDLSVGHPFKPFVDAVKKYKVDKAKAQFRQVAESFFSKCYLTTLCLQYKPSHIAAGVLFLAAEHLNMNLQSYGEGLYQDFDIAPRQLEEICGQMLELFVNKHISTSQGSIVERSNRRDIVQQPVSKEMASTDKCPSSDTGGSPSKANLSQSNDHLVHDDVSRPEGIEKDNSESEAGENRDGHSIRTVTSEASDDIGVSLVEKDLQLRSEEVKGKGEKDDNDMSEREVEDVELDDEDDKTMEKISPSFSKVGYSDSNSVEHSEN